MIGDRRWARLALAAIPVAFLGYFFVYPLVSILTTGFSDGADAFEVLSRGSTRSVAWFTLWQATVSTIVTVIIALPGAYLLGRYEFRGKGLLKAAITVPFIMPTVVVGGAFLTLLGPAGPLGIDLRRTVWAIIVAHVFFNYAVVVRTVSSAWERLDPELSAAARSLGANRTKVLRHVTFPLLAPAIASAASIVFLFSFTSFGVVLILGDLVHSTLEVEIWRQATSLLNLPAAATLAVVQLIAITAVLVFYSRYQRSRAVAARVAALRATAVHPTTPRQKLLVALNLTLMAALLLSPLASIVIRSVSTDSGWGLDNFTNLVEPTSALFVPAIEAIRNSIWIATLATAIAVAIGILTAWSIDRATTRFGQSLDVLIMLPLGTSAVTLGFGFLIALDAPIDLRSVVLDIANCSCPYCDPFCGADDAAGPAHHR